MYNSEIHGYLKSLLKESYSDWSGLTQKYLSTFHLWIKNNSLNQFKGLPPTGIFASESHTL